MPRPCQQELPSIEGECNGDVAVSVGKAVVLLEISRRKLAAPHDVVIPVIGELDGEAVGFGLDLDLPAGLPGRDLPAVVLVDEEYTLGELGGPFRHEDGVVPERRQHLLPLDLDHQVGDLRRVLRQVGRDGRREGLERAALDKELAAAGQPGIIVHMGLELLEPQRLVVGGPACGGRLRAEPAEQLRRQESVVFVVINHPDGPAAGRLFIDLSRTSPRRESFFSKRCFSSSYVFWLSSGKVTKIYP